MDKFLAASRYIDFDADNIQAKIYELFSDSMSSIDKARIAFEFVRDEIPHSFDCDATVITARASDVLKHRTGICHAKANLLAALLRSQGVPTGFCFQRITLADDDSMGYCVHAFNAVYVGGKWIKLDARGNKPGVHTHFSTEEPSLAFECRPEYEEHFWKGIYAEPHLETMRALEESRHLQDVIEKLPDEIERPIPMDNGMAFGRIASE